ncbi:hypothetical protein [Halomicrococcus sp. NG-SE-24]|uniref:hypothetical protein n=1 Tax=Halomicrococcus sp. NG-SE-24 TaxID=3436928 RepID=UPI003D95B738
MPRNSPVTVNRRRFLSATAASTVALGGLSTTQARQSDGSKIVIEQDGKCIPLQPLSYEGLPVEQFYDYRTPDTEPSSYKYASFGTQQLQRKNTSIMFLYDGPKGLSLVVIHDKLHSTGSGGAVTFRLTRLPAKGKWVVKDDSYDGPTNRDTFDHSINRDWEGKKTATSVINWTWQDGRADGGVYRGLGDEFEFKIHPAFNEKATLSSAGEGPYEGKINKWEVLSGNVNNPTRTELKMQKPVTIKTGSCNGSSKQTSTSSSNSDDQTSSRETSSSPRSTTTTPGGASGQSRGFFERIWDGLGAALNAVLSFFGNLF